jgi:diguanylate cyclase (GGDEF)-like protein
MPVESELNLGDITVPLRSKRLIVPIIGIVLCFCAICAYVLFQARQTALERAADVATSLVAAVESDMARNIESVDLSLQGVIDNLKLPEFDRIDPDLRRVILFDRSAMAKNLGKILVADEAGNVTLDSKDLNPPPLNIEGRDFFQAHKNNPDIGMHISRPAISHTGNYWFVGISRRISRADGSFAGVAVASLRLSYFEHLFKTIAHGTENNITLSRTDGIVLMRWPYKEGYVGVDLRNARIYKELARSPHGRFETNAATDGVHRLIVYSQVGTLPLVIGVGQSTADIYRPWNNFAFGIVFFVAVLCAIISLLAQYLIRDLERRRAAETRLSMLAATDSLTGLSNRRHFNETLGREWHRARRDRSQLAFMMLDGDKFKGYNDTQGHPAGDVLLKTLGETITSVLKRSSDIGARYGGDEFAILLPATTAEGALRVAANLRAAFAKQCQLKGILDIGISIGVACLTPAAGLKSHHLVGLADQALYRAKADGGNRIEVAAQVEAIKAVTSQNHRAA